MATNNAINNFTAGVGTRVSSNDVSTLISNKGDLLVGNGVNSATNLPVGTDNYYLIADSSQSTGMRYSATQPSITQVSRAFGYGNTLTNYIVPVHMSSGGSGSASSMVADTLYCFPFSITISTTFTLIGIRVNITSANTVRLGIYDSSGSGGYPGSLVLDAGTVSTDTTSGEKTISISQLLYGNYWIAMISSGTPSINIAGTPAMADNVVGGISTSQTNVMTALTEASVGSYFTALPASLSSDTFTFSTASTSSFLVFLQV